MHAVSSRAGPARPHCFLHPSPPHLPTPESLFERAHLSSALPRLTRLSSLALDKCEIHGGFPSELSLLTSLRILSVRARDPAWVWPAQAVGRAVWGGGLLWAGGLCVCRPPGVAWPAAHQPFAAPAAHSASQFDGCICHEPPQQHGSTLWAVLARLTGLQSLSLSNCNLHELPPAVVALPRLQVQRLCDRGGPLHTA